MKLHFFKKTYDFYKITEQFWWFMNLLQSVVSTSSYYSYLKSMDRCGFSSKFVDKPRLAYFAMLEDVVLSWWPGAVITHFEELCPLLRGTSFKYSKSSWKAAFVVLNTEQLRSGQLSVVTHACHLSWPAWFCAFIGKGALPGAVFCLMVGQQMLWNNADVCQAVTSASPVYQGPVYYYLIFIFSDR